MATRCADFGAPGRSRTGFLHRDRVAAPLFALGSVPRPFWKPRRDLHPLPPALQAGASLFGIAASRIANLIGGAPGNRTQFSWFSTRRNDHTCTSPVRLRIADWGLNCVVALQFRNPQSEICNLQCLGVSYGSRTRSSRLTISRAHPAHSGHHELRSLVGRGGVEPPHAVHQTAMQSATSPSDRLPHLVGMAGFEPAPSWFQARRSAQTELHPVNFSFLLLRAPESRTRPACL